MTPPRPTGTALARARAWFAGDPGRGSLARVLGCLVSTRLVLGLVGYAAVRLNHPLLHPRARHDFPHGAAIVGWLRWDAWWYVSVVEDGYFFEPRGESNVAFLPGFPALVALVTPLFGSAAIAGLVVANVSFALGIVVFWSWVRERAGLAVAERAVLWLLLYPLSFFFDTGYSEGLYFLLCTLALRDADRGRFRTAGIFAACATLTRPMGLFLVPAFAWGLVPEFRASRSRPKAALPLLLPAIALGLYSLYLWATLGSPTVMWKAQRVGWELGKHFNSFQLPVRTDGYRKILDVLHLLLPIPLCALTIQAWRRLGPASGVYAAMTVLLVVAFGWDSLGRETLALIPVFAVAGFAALRPVTLASLRLAMFALLVVFTYAFTTAHFMG